VRQCLADVVQERDTLAVRDIEAQLGCHE
jgi:hypothetical protein